MRLLSFIILSLLTCTTLKAADSLVIHRVSPLPLNENGQAVFNLSGDWLFHPAAPVGFEKETNKDASWKKIEVPGEWAMQGFKVEKNNWAGYTRHFSVPAEWKDKRIKLRCDGIYSQCEIFINGEKVAEHLGGFTAFETDITNFTKAGLPAVIAVKVKNESVADSLASGSKYAVHPLGGITRKVQLIALPAINIGGLQVLTSFDNNYNNATLSTEIQIRNESKSDNSIALLFELFSPLNKEKVFSKEIPVTGLISAGEQIDRKFDFAISNPLKWDAEHPRLYRLKTTLLLNGKAEEVVEKNIGFRQIEVRGNRVYVNNFPIKLRGVCRHETMPLRGRSLTGNQWAEDVKIFREGNVNYIRTSHYPPPEELVQACDSLGMFLEVEAPFCWAHQTNVASADSVAVLQSQTLDMVQFFKSSPSVLMWSMGNESLKFKEYFSKTAELVKKLDPSRPRIFSQWSPDADGNALEIGNHHYPGPEGPAKYADAKRPIVFDEYVHINAYNRFELAADPGIRDAWGIGFAAMWNNMYKTPAVLGGAIWAGIDDTFVWEDTTAVGYGTWGVIDGWRREKPEYWHMKKVYSPVIISQKTNWRNSGVLFTFENRHLFSNLSECNIQWQLGNQSGTISPSAAPGQAIDYSINCKQPLPTEIMLVKVYDARNVLVDEYAFANLAPELTEVPVADKPSGLKWSYAKQADGSLLAGSQGIEVSVHKNGLLQVFKNKKQICDGFAELMLLPLNDQGDGIQMTGKSQRFPAYTATAKNRILQKIAYKTEPASFTITVQDVYDEAEGFTTYRFQTNGTINVNYRYQLKKEINPRQWGMVFNLPSSFSNLQWERKGFWNFYPSNHIGRIKGMAEAAGTTVVSGAAGPLQKPDQPWKFDKNEWGSNDFRSTKMNILKASLANKTNSLQLQSDGACHIRCWTESGFTRLLIAPYSNLGTEGFFRDHAKLFDKPLKQGDIIEGAISLLIK